MAKKYKFLAADLAPIIDELEEEILYLKLIMSKVGERKRMKIFK